MRLSFENMVLATLAVAANNSFVAVSATKQETCYALALNGGGAKGAYQAGAIYGFMHEGNPDDFQWDVVTGISGGAINAGALSVWAKEDGLEMSEWLSDTWNNLHTHDVWKWWPGGLVEGFKGQSLVDDTPLVNYLTEIYKGFPEGVKRKSMIGTVDANNAHYKKFFLDELPEDVEAEVWAKQVVSSASIPFLFAPQKIDGGVYVDGGTAMGLDGISAVERCLEMVNDESQITMDIMLLDRFAEVVDHDDEQHTLKNLLRTHQVKHYYKGLENVITTMLAHPNVNYRYILEPSGWYPKLWNLLNFSTDNTWPMQQNGREDAKTALEAGEGFHFQKFHDWIATRDDHNQSVKQFIQQIIIDQTN